METTMKKIFWAAPVLLLAILMVFSFGCTDKSGSNQTTGGSGQVGQVQILATDTLRYVPGDSASTPVTIIVSDDEGRVLSGRRVGVSLVNPSLGFLQFQNTTLRDTTDEFGRVDMLYTSVNRSGSNTIIAICEGVQAEPWPIVILENTTVIRNLTLNLSRHTLSIPVGQEDTISVAVRITDEAGIGINNVNVHLSTDLGALQPLGVTDSSGSARTVWFSNADTGMVHIHAWIADLSKTDSLHVTSQATQGTLHLTAQFQMVRANNCVTPDSLRATLHDQRNIAVAGDTVWFMSFGGTATARAITDTLGRAFATFCDVGIPSEDDSAMVVAWYPRWSLYDTVRIWVAPALNIGQVNFTLANSTGIAGVDSTPVNVGVFYENFSGVTGLPITFYASCGTFTYAQEVLNNGTLPQPNYYRFCNTITDANNVVRLWAVVGNELAHSDTLFPTVNPGPARQLAVLINRSPIQLNDTTGVRAFVLDSLGNPVRRGRPVTFTTTRGTINPSAPDVAETDDYGIAWATLSSGTSAGQAIVKGSLGAGLAEDSTVVAIIANDAASITLTPSNTSPEVAGTGGIDWSQLYAAVTDANGNPVPDGRWVTFEILYGLPGGGVNINDHGLIDSAQTAGGTAIATLRSGTVPGPVQLEARTTVEGNVIRARSGIVSIVAGPPENITMYPTEVGERGGGATWLLELSALVTDTYGNPVRDGTAVFFSIYPDTAQITSDSVFTYNEDVNGDQRHGIAYTRLSYESPATFQEVQIIAQTGGNQPATEEITFTLPIQEPELSLYLLPQNWDFSQPNQAEARVEARCVLTDGYHRVINGGYIVYALQRGRLCTSGSGNCPPGERYWAITGPAPQGNPGGNDGECSLWLRGTVDMYFIDAVSLEATCEVSVELQGHPDATDSRLENFRRQL